MRSMLVTGGAGFIGSNFIHYLLREEPGVSIVNLDALTYAGNLDNLAGLPDPTRHHFVQGDICDTELVRRLFEEHAFSTVVHFAAETHVDRSIVDPGRFVQTNINGTYTLLEAARRAWVEQKLVPLESARFHHVSTDEVYGTLTPDDPPFRETTPYAPSSPYSASKAASDHLVRAYGLTFGLPVSITNCSNNYGPYQHPEKLIPLMVLHALEGRPLPVYGDGMQVRDWLYVEDHCAAIWQVIQRGHAGETYNVGGDNQSTNLLIVRTICGILDELAPAPGGRSYEQQIQHVQDRPAHDRRYAMDIHKIQQHLGWRPAQSLHSGLFETVQWLLAHPEWVATVRARPDYSGWLEQNYSRREGRP